jgi:hypothetical protein
MSKLRVLAAAALVAASLTLGSCSVVVAGAKAIEDGVTYVFTPGHYVHSSEPYGTDMLSAETSASLANEYQMRERAFHKDMTEVYDSFNKWFFNYDKDDPYVY